MQEISLSVNSFPPAPEGIPAVLPERPPLGDCVSCPPGMSRKEFRARALMREKALKLAPDPGGWPAAWLEIQQRWPASSALPGAHADCFEVYQREAEKTLAWRDANSRLVEFLRFASDRRRRVYYAPWFYVPPAAPQGETR